MKHLITIDGNGEPVADAPEATPALMQRTRDELDDRGPLDSVLLDPEPLTDEEAMKPGADGRWKRKALDYPE